MRTATKIVYERQPCGRCGGSGRYSWCQRYGSTCFGCGGTGTKLSTNGKRAKKAVSAWQTDNLTDTVAEMEVGVGYHVQETTFGGGEISTRHRKAKLESIDGEGDSLTLRFKGVDCAYGVRDTSTYRRCYTPADFAEMAAVAERYKGATVEYRVEPEPCDACEEPTNNDTARYDLKHVGSIEGRLCGECLESMSLLEEA